MPGQRGDFTVERLNAASYTASMSAAVESALEQIESAAFAAGAQVLRDKQKRLRVLDALLDEAQHLRICDDDQWRSFSRAIQAWEFCHPPKLLERRFEVVAAELERIKSEIEVNESCLTAGFVRAYFLFSTLRFASMPFNYQTICNQREEVIKICRGA